jgi:ketosteroid isomerase-like protein
MSRENVETAHRILAALSKRDLDVLTGFVEPDARWRSFFAALSQAGEYRGHDGLRQYMTDLEETFEFLHADVADMLDAGDVVVGLGTIHYRGRGSGVETQSAAGWVFKFRDGKLLQFRAFRDPEQALERVGLEVPQTALRGGSDAARFLHPR